MEEEKAGGMDVVEAGEGKTKEVGLDDLEKELKAEEKELSDDIKNLEKKVRAYLAYADTCPHILGPFRANT